MITASKRIHFFFLDTPFAQSCGLNSLNFSHPVLSLSSMPLSVWFMRLSCLPMYLTCSVRGNILIFVPSFRVSSSCFLCCWWVLSFCASAVLSSFVSPSWFDATIRVGSLFGSLSVFVGSFLRHTQPLLVAISWFSCGCCSSQTKFEDRESVWWWRRLHVKDSRCVSLFKLHCCKLWW